VWPLIAGGDLGFGEGGLEEATDMQAEMGLSPLCFLGGDECGTQVEGQDQEVVA
jgi:hypothetical protein